MPSVESSTPYSQPTNEGHHEQLETPNQTLFHIWALARACGVLAHH